MYKPLVSVIIPVYNRTVFVQKAVDSVFAQTYKNFELLIIDDGSNKLTRKVLANYQNPKIRVIRQKHRGVSAARNNGIQNSLGEFIAFLDSDDVWHPDKLAKQITFFEENPDCLINQTDEFWLRNGKRVNPQIKHKKRDGIFFEESLKLCLVTTSSILCRRQLFSIVGTFDKQLPACEDYDLYLRILAKKIPICLVPEKLMTRFAGHHDQLSLKYPAMDRYRIQTLKKLLLCYELGAKQKERVKGVLEKKLNILMQGSAKRKKVVSFIKYWLAKKRFC